MSKKTNTFKKWQEERSNETKELIRKALVFLSNSHYDNKTRLAKDVAKLVTELKVQANEKLPDDKRLPEVKPVSHVTLLRNKEYLTIITVALDELMGIDSVEEPSISDHESLKIRNASLESQIENLKRKVRKLDLNGPLAIENNEESTDEIKRKDEQISLLLKIVDSMHNEVRDALIIVREDEVGAGRPVAGMYGPFNLVATWGELEELNRIRDEQNKRG